MSIPETPLSLKSNWIVHPIILHSSQISSLLSYLPAWSINVLRKLSSRVSKLLLFTVIKKALTCANAHCNLLINTFIKPLKQLLFTVPAKWIRFKYEIACKALKPIPFFNKQHKVDIKCITSCIICFSNFIYVLATTKSLILPYSSRFLCDTHTRPTLALRADESDKMLD